LSRIAAGEPAMTLICPRCTLAQTGRAAFNAGAGYRARLCSRDPFDRSEQDDGSIADAPASRRHALLAARLDDVEHALAASGKARRARVLHIGTRDGELLARARARLRIKPIALEPWLPWAQQARALDLEVDTSTLEGWRRRGTFDLIIEHDLLPHLADPLEHLRAIAARLSETGVAVLEVPNLLVATGISHEHVLSPTRPFWFTARALVGLCKRAGLAPFFLAADERLRVLCRRAPPNGCVPPGPDAHEVAQIVWGNDLRLQLKRALSNVGAAPGSIRAAAAIHSRCSHKGVRADLALEIANACERCSDLENATHWLQLALLDRDDSEVERTLARLCEVRERIVQIWHEEAAANDDASAAFRLAS
jgi:Methyltransferase domain